MIERILAILSKEFRQIFRDPRMRTVIFISPLIQLFLFGYAATRDLTDIPIAVYDLDNTKESREIIRRFYYSKYFNIREFVHSEQEQSDTIDRSHVYAVLKFNKNFGRDVYSGREAEAQLILDGTDSNSATIALGYANTIIGNYNQEILDERLAAYQAPGRIIPKVDLRDRHWFNENLESRNYYLPGVIALIVTVMSLLLSSMAIVREKEIGTMEQLIVSPIRPVELILGKIIPFGIIALIQVVFITSVGLLWFHIPLRGNILFLMLCTLIYLLTTLGIGLFISAISSTQQEAMMSVFLFFMPANLLSGFGYPIANMPEVVQYITLLNPLRYFLLIVREIFLKGNGIAVLWDEMLVLFLMGVCIIFFSSLKFRKQLG
ncbi:MAG: ABC transporter permease [Candidatus Omnitrophota bacterium]|nr:ABC transporter permease [Candidatus Omnitrophota bacterium]